MENLQYGHLIKPLSAGAIDFRELPKAPGQDGPLAIGPGNASLEYRLNGRDHLEGLKLNFSWGVHTEPGEWHAGMDPHVHPYPEILMFVGLDTANVKYLGAEVSCCLGPELETHTFADPTVIVVPAGMPHGPITTNRMYSPRGFGFWAVELNEVPEMTWLGEGVSGVPADMVKTAPEGMRFAAPEKILPGKPSPATGKYAHLVKPLKSYMLIERGKFNPSRLTPEQIAAQEEKIRKGEMPGPGSTDHLAWMFGRDLEGLNANILWGFCSRPGIWRRGAGAHAHPADEVLVYLGMDPDNPDSLGAEIEMDLGKEHERHFIDRSAALVCPAGMPHLPQVTRWVDRPFAFFAVTLSGEHEAITAD